MGFRSELIWVGTSEWIGAISGGRVMRVFGSQQVRRTRATVAFLQRPSQAKSENF